MCDSKTVQTVIASDQTVIPFKRARVQDGLNEVAKLVYEDNIPVYKVVRSPTLQSFFKQLHFSKVTYCSVNNALEVNYQTAAGSSNSNSNSQTSNSNYSFQTQTQTVDVYILKLVLKLRSLF